MLRRAPIVFLVLVTTLGLPGCNIVAPIYYLLHGPPRTPAAFELADRPTVVFVDDRNNQITRNSDNIRRKMADTVSTELMKKKILTTTIRPADAIALAKQHDRYQDVMPMDEIGRSAGAEQVIYVEILTFRESVDGVTPRPGAAVNLRVIDVVNKVRLFPGPESAEPGYLVELSLPPISPELYRSRDGRLQIFELMAAALGEQIAKVFYEHETKELGGQLDPR